MKLNINHKLQYHYSSEVTLDPHKIYLYPRLNDSLILVNYALKIFPEPSQISKNIDLEGNIQFVAFFNQKTEKLELESTIVIETEYFNAFDFVYFPFETSLLPFEYSIVEKEMLLPYLSKKEVTTLVDQVARNIAADAGWSTTKFLINLSEYIYKTFSYSVREEGLPQDPEVTLLSKSGSCRDYSVFFMACCKAMGLASRFVSGYYHTKSLQQNYLHAWVEVYLPGGGWRGFDPTQNNVVSSLHIPLASSAFPQSVTPVSGSFRGNSQSSLFTHVFIENLDK